MMKTIAPTLHGLASTMLLNLGLIKAAEKLDPLLASQDVRKDALSAGACTACVPCHYRPRRRS
jgi:hypothetical protein